MVFDNIISKFFSEKNKFDKVCIDKGVISSIIFYAKKSYPNEFLAMLDGYIKSNVLYINSLLFLPGERSHTSASFNDWMIPPTQKKWGSVHSHPGYNASPSNADLMTFSKYGAFHIIVCEPYSLETMHAYDSYGNPTTFEVGEFSNSEPNDIFDDLEDIRNEIDGLDDKEVNPGLFDLDRDMSYFNDDVEKVNKYSDNYFDLDDVEKEYYKFISSSDYDNCSIFIEFKDGKPILKFINLSDSEDFEE